MYCAHCGTPLEPGMRFCPGCGAPRGDRPRPPWETDPPPGRSRDRDDDDRRDIHVHVHTHQDRAQPERMRIAAPAVAPRGVGASYVPWAWLTLILYCFGYVPGLIANIMLLRRVGRFERETGVEPKGSGCASWLLLAVGIGFPVLVVIGAVSGG